MADPVAPRPLSATAAAEIVTNTLGSPIHVVGPLAGGETGATEVADDDGRRMVLKWEHDPDNQARRREGADLAELLRVAAGWPAPQQRLVDADGCLFILQTFMPGGVVEHLSHALLDELFELHERRVGLARPSDADRWADDLVEVLVDGGRDYCLHEPLRRFDPRTRRLVERIEEIGRAVDPRELGGGDVVHGDLHPGNLLEVDGRLSAVVDLDYAHVGDADFDLTMLALASLSVGAEQGVRSRLFDRGIRALPAGRRDAYVGGLLLRFLDWPIRKGRHDEVEFWITESEQLLAG